MHGNCMQDLRSREQSAFCSNKWKFTELYKNCVSSREMNAGSVLINQYSFYRYVKRVIKQIRKKKQTEEDTYTRWERDFYLLPNQPQGLLYEYLQIGKTLDMVEWVRKGTLKRDVTLLFISFSNSIWICHTLCLNIPTGSSVCSH